MKPLVIILSLLCLALAAQLFLRQSNRQHAEQDLAAAAVQLQSLSNEIAETRGKLDEESRLAGYLQSNLTQKVTDLAVVSNSLLQASSTLAGARGDLKSAQNEVQMQAARMAELEGQRDEMQSKLTELAGSIKTLDVKIVETKRQLAAAEGDRDSLTRQLVQLQTDKAELLRQFNDLAALKAQVALLKEEAAVNQRLAWTAQGVYQTSGRKGAEALLTRSGSVAAVPSPSLNVELQQSGGSRAPSTNAPVLRQ